MINFRHQQEATLGRRVSTSSDNGETWSAVHFDAALIGPVCQGSIVSFNNATFFSNPSSKTARDMLTVRRSTDDAKTWEANTQLIQQGASAGYSSLVQGELQKVSSPGLGGILFEATIEGHINFKTFPLVF